MCDRFTTARPTKNGQKILIVSSRKFFPAGRRFVTVPAAVFLRFTAATCITSLLRKLPDFPERLHDGKSVSRLLIPKISEPEPFMPRVAVSRFHIRRLTSRSCHLIAARFFWGGKDAMDASFVLSADSLIRLTRGLSGGGGGGGG